MAQAYAGEIAALAVAVCWSISSTMFERSGKRAGSLAVNHIRLVFACILLGVYGWVVKGSFMPMGASSQQWVWLSISGFFGLFLGDIFLFKSLTLIGARLSMLVMTFAPVLTALIGWVALDESLLWYQWIAILLTVSGILVAFVGMNKRQFTFKLSLKGFLFALGGAVGQALGLIFSKKGMGSYDPFAATQIRILTGLVCFTLFVLLAKRWREVGAACRNRIVIKDVFVGSFFGPFLGVALSMYAITKTETGVASALMALTPLVLIVPAVIKGRAIAAREWVGALISVIGVILLFI